MVRIIGIQRSNTPEREFVLLQNQGTLRANLRGHVVMSEGAVEDGDLSFGAHVFKDDELIPAGMYVVLYSGHGEPRWSRTKEGAMVYYTFMNRSRSVWENTQGPLHVLSPHHTYSERAAAVTLR